MEPDTALAAMPTDKLCVNTLRTLAMDAVEAAQSGHPGTPMALAPAAYVLWSRILRHNPANPRWPDRDRFILSCGHASMLLYGLLHLSGYDLPLERLKHFRQWDSGTPGHPEYGEPPGVEMTTGPLGQGFMHAVGMALAEAHLADRYNRNDCPVVDHHTFVFCSDGDLMEGASHEAASLAGHLGLGKLVVLYDQNHISIDGPTELTLSDDPARRFAANGWQVQELGDAANDLHALEQAFKSAVAESERPTLLVLRSHIAWGAPNAQDTAAAHGAPLGAGEVRAAKRHYGWPEDVPFFVPDRVYHEMTHPLQRQGETLEAEWRERLGRFREHHPELAAGYEAALAGEPAEGWDEGLPEFGPEDGPVATRATAGRALRIFGDRIPWLMAGAADLAASTKAAVDGEAVSRNAHAGRNIHWGVREHLMCAASTGMALHGGVRPVASTFFIFTDYARPAIRLAALMRQPVIYALSHDSIGLGEDGPTHQPVEHLASFRAMPNVCVLRPADANEAVQAWRTALKRTSGPTLLVLSRQKLPVFKPTRTAAPEGVPRGAYILRREAGERPDLVLIASGSEVQLVMAAAETLERDHQVDARVVSMPSWELFRDQDKAYRDRVLPPTVERRLAVEAGASLGWCEWVGVYGAVIGIDRFGASAPGEVLFEKLGLTVENVVAEAETLLGT